MRPAADDVAPRAPRTPRAPRVPRARRGSCRRCGHPLDHDRACPQAGRARARRSPRCPSLKQHAAEGRGVVQMPTPQGLIRQGEARASKVRRGRDRPNCCHATGVSKAAKPCVDTTNATYRYRPQFLPHLRKNRGVQLAGCSTALDRTTCAGYGAKPSWNARSNSYQSSLPSAERLSEYGIPRVRLRIEISDADGAAGQRVHVPLGS